MAGAAQIAFDAALIAAQFPQSERPLRQAGCMPLASITAVAAAD